MRALFEAMCTGGDFGIDAIPYFNGGLFADADVIELRPDEIRVLTEVSRFGWEHVEPSIFSTLFERLLDPSKRSQIVAAWDRGLEVWPVERHNHETADLHLDLNGVS